MNGSWCFLGTGSSLGVPVIGCECSTCRSMDPKNKRSRTAGLLTYQGRKVLIDAGPDYRQQALSHSISSLDGVILTHAHYDHIGGVDDLKVYGHREKRLPCLMLQSTFEDIKVRYSYFIKPQEEEPFYSPFFSWQILTHPSGEVVFQGLPLTYVTFFQLQMQVLGFKIGDLAYISDIKRYDDTLFGVLGDVRTLIISAIRKEGSIMHLSLDEALSFAKRVRAKQTYLTHMAHELEYETLKKELPSYVIPAYDGLQIPFTVS